MAKKQRSLEEQAATDPGAKLVLADKRQESVRDWYAAMIGEIVVVYANFIYTGELTAIDDATVWIKDPSIIYDSGLPTADKWADESRMSVRRLCIQRSSIESMGVVDRT